MKRGTVDHPKTIALAQRLGIEQWAAVGILETLWHWTARYARRGDVGRYSDGQIAQGIHWQEQAPGVLIAALVETGWLDTCGDHRLVIHDLADHADDAWRKSLQRSGLTFISQCPDCVRTASGRQGDYPVPVPEPVPVPVFSSPDVLPGVFVTPLARVGGGTGGTKRAAQRRSPPARSWPDDFKLTEERREVARAFGLDPATEWNKFHDHALAHGSRYVNWDAAWRSWCRNAHRFAGRAT